MSINPDPKKCFILYQYKLNMNLIITNNIIPTKTTIKQYNIITW